MSVSSKTGLIPTQKRYTRPYRKKKAVVISDGLPTATVTRPVEFSVRPFGGLYNPYSKGCSVLCNHPAPVAVRSIIRKMKDSWSSDGKIYWQDISMPKDSYPTNGRDTPDHIPEDLFRRYTDTDSRPLTPSPTTASVRTRTSAGSFLNARRCVTPEPGKDTIHKRKKIILDLRRSHSQETLYWKAPSDISQSIAMDISSNLVIADDIKEETKVEEQKQKPIILTPEKEVPRESVAPSICINERDIDESDMQRRGKKKKRMKPPTSVTTFHLNQDPETQVSTLGPDSLSASTRPSLVPNAAAMLLSASAKQEEMPTQFQNSFLTHDAFRVLKTELDIDVIENTFERYLDHHGPACWCAQTFWEFIFGLIKKTANKLNRALREAIKYVPAKGNQKTEKHPHVEETKDLYFEKEANMPRKFSKAASRFEMPLDLHVLENISVFEYLSSFVWVSRQRKQLYKKVFVKYLVPEEEPLEEVEQVEAPERKMFVNEFSVALKEVLGLYGTDDVIKTVSKITGVTQLKEINFRSWCGIVAFGERYAVDDPQESDSCDELEKADFDTLEQQMKNLKLPQDMKTVLTIIRRGHNAIYD